MRLSFQSFNLKLRLASLKVRSWSGFLTGYGIAEEPRLFVVCRYFKVFHALIYTGLTLGGLMGVGLLIAPVCQ